MTWYKNGLRFECQGSGKCCVSRGGYGYVYLTEDDHQLLSDFLGEAPETDKDRLGNVHLKSVDTDCQYLKGTKCSVYEARPTQCRTWPFWSENLKSQRAWDKEVASYCPGVGKGRLYAAEEIDDYKAQ